MDFALRMRIFVFKMMKFVLTIGEYCWAADMFDKSASVRIEPKPVANCNINAISLGNYVENAEISENCPWKMMIFY